MLTALLAGAALVAHSPSGSSPRDPIAAYQGSWRATVQRFETEFSHKGSEVRRIDNDCRRLGAFFLCSQRVNGIEKALLAYRPNGAGGTYDSYTVPAGGGAPGKGILAVEGDEFRFPWDQNVGGGIVHFRVVNRFAGHDRIDY